MEDYPTLPLTWVRFTVRTGGGRSGVCGSSLVSGPPPPDTQVGIPRCGSHVLSLDPPIHGYYATPSGCANATAAAQQASSLPSRRRRRYHTHLESLATPAIDGPRLNWTGGRFQLLDGGRGDRAGRGGGPDLAGVAVQPRQDESDEGERWRLRSMPTWTPC